VALTRVDKSSDLELHGLLTAQKTHKKIHDLETGKLKRRSGQRRASARTAKN
jgi:hypothetical protein